MKMCELIVSHGLDREVNKKKHMIHVIFQLFEMVVINCLKVYLVMNFTLRHVEHNSVRAPSLCLKCSANI